MSVAFGKRKDVIFYKHKIRRIYLQLGSFYDRFSCTKRRSAKLNHPLSQRVHMGIDFSAEAVKHFMDCDELSSPQIPMCLFRGKGEVDSIDQARI